MNNVCDFSQTFVLVFEHVKVLFRTFAFRSTCDPFPLKLAFEIPMQIGLLTEAMLRLRLFREKLLIIFIFRCRDGYIGPRCDYKDLDGSYLGELNIFYFTKILFN